MLYKKVGLDRCGENAYLEVFAAGCQHCFMSLKVNAVHHKSAVTQKSQLSLLVQLLQDVLAVLGKIHGWGKP